MINSNEIKEINVLGYDIKFKDGDLPEGVTASDISNLIEAESEKFGGQLDQSKTLLLVALKLATDKLALEKEFKTKVDTFHRTAAEALSLIEEVQPRTH